MTAKHTLFVVEYVDHLFMKCSLVRMLWNIVKCAFNLLDIHDSVNASLGTWIQIFHVDENTWYLQGFLWFSGPFGRLEMALFFITRKSMTIVSP